MLSWLPATGSWPAPAAGRCLRDPTDLQLWRTGLGRYAANVPISVLAAILLKSGLDVMDFAYLRRLPNLPATSVIVMVRSPGWTRPADANLT